MYSIRRDPNNSYCYSQQYWTINCQQQHQQFIFNSRQIIRSKQQYFWSTKLYNNNNKDYYIQCQTFNNSNSIKSTDLSNSNDLTLPVYRAPCTFQSSLVADSKGRNRSTMIELSQIQFKNHVVFINDKINHLG